MTIHGTARKKKIVQTKSMIMLAGSKLWDKNEEQKVQIFPCKLAALRSDFIGQHYS